MSGLAIAPAQAAWADRDRHPASLQEVVDWLATETGAPVTLEDADLRLLVHSAHGPVVDGPRQATIMTRRAPDWAQLWLRGLGLPASSEPVRVPADPALGLLPRVVVAVRRHGRLHGWVWLLDAQGLLDDDALAAAAQAATMAARLLASGRSRGPDLRHARDAVVERLLDGDAVVRAQAAADAIAGGLLPDGPLRVVVAEAAGIAPSGRTEMLATWRRSVEQSPLPWAHGTAHDGALVALVGVPDGRSVNPRDLGGRIRRALAAAGHEVSIGVGAAQDGLVDVVTSATQARGACTVARRVDEDGVACWDDLGVYRALLSLPQPLDAALLDPRVTTAAADGMDPAQLATVEAYLDQGASPGRTARRLHVHRGTVYYRLQRFTELTGCDLDNGTDRLAVHLTLKALRLTAPVGRAMVQGSPGTSAAGGSR